MSEVLKYSMSWLVKILFCLIAIFIFQLGVTASASPIIFESGHHTGISEIYTSAEIENLVWEKVDRTTGLSRVLSAKEVRPDQEVLADVASVAAKTSNILGKSFGRLGTVVENPNIGVKMLDEGGHYLTGKINRMVPSADVIGTLKNPSVVLQQANGRYLYLSQKAGVVINQNGKLITTYGSGNFDANILNVLKAAGY